MNSLRTRLIVLICLLISIIDVGGCFLFYIHTKNAQEKVFEKLGMSLVTILAQDSEVELAINHAQPAFLRTPVKRVLAFDRDKEIAYWRITNTQVVMLEEKAWWCNVKQNEIPGGDNSVNAELPYVIHKFSVSGEVFYDFKAPVYEKGAFSEESFATRILEEDSSLAETKKNILGFVQIGLSTHIMNEKIREVVLFAIIPLGIGVIFGGAVITLFFTRYIVSPIKQLANITLEVAEGNLSRVVDIHYRDEIGQLSVNFNQMMRALEKSYADLRQEIAGHKHTSELLDQRLKIESLIATISSTFINLAPREADAGILRALKIIGEFCGVDRCYVFQYADKEKKKMANTHEWCAEGVEPMIDKYQDVSVEQFPWGMEKLEQSEIIHVPRVADMPECAKAERELQLSQSVQSFVIVPLLYGGSLVGLLGFDLLRTEKILPEDDISLLKITGEIFVNALEHKRTWEMLQKAHDNLERRVKERTTDLLKANELLKDEIAEHKKAKSELNKYEILFSEINDLPYILDTKGNILFVNHMFDKLTGRKRGEFIGKSFAPLFDKENLILANEAYTNTLKGQCPQYELYFKETGILCEYKNLPLRNEEGTIIGVIGTARDVTERKRMTDALRQAKEYAESLIETANVIVMGLDMQGNIWIFNKTAEDITGYTKAEILGKNCYDVLTPKDVFPYVWQNFQKWQNDKILQTAYENTIITKSGKRRYISWQNTEVRDQGRVVGTISFGIDITEKKYEKALVERLRLMSFVKDISIAINQGTTMHEILQQCAEAIIHNLDAAFARIWTFNEKENILELQASAGMYTHIDGAHSRIPVGKLKIGIIAQERISHLTNNYLDDPDVSDKDWVKREGLNAFVGHPLMVKEHLVGVVAMFSRKPLTDFIQRALASAADIIALGIDRKLSEEYLRVSENRYRRLLENLPQKIFHKDRHSVYVSCNENYAKDLNIKPEEILGKTDFDFYPESLANKYRSDDNRVMVTGITEDIDDKYIRDGKEYFIHIVKSPLRDENGNIIGLLGIFWDITEKIAMQMEAVRSRNLVALGEMAAGVAHEINNPITGIINYSQIIVNKNTEGSRECELARRIIKEGERIAIIVRSLLSFARSDERKLRKSPVSVSDIISETLTLTEAQMRKEGIVLKLNVPSELPKVSASLHQIQQVFLNIVSNARYALNQKYQEAHDDKILEIIGEKISIGNCLYVKILFYDHGVGIPEDIMNKIMTPFFTTKPVGKGTGLGLSISHGIISEHRGKLVVESAEGEFTKVAVILPVI